MTSRMTKTNAREILFKICDQFRKVTGESIGITYSWFGSLNILGSDKFREIITQDQEEVWRSLTFHSNNTPVTKPFADREMFNLLNNNENCNKDQLRKLISWATQKSVGRSRNIWGDDSNKPSWWPEEIPFVCISKNTKENIITKSKLLKIVEAYKLSLDLANAKHEIITSTPVKRTANTSISSPFIKKEKIEDSLSSDEFFGGLFDTPEKLPILPKLPLSHPTYSDNLQCIINPSVKQSILKELNSNEMLSDETIHYFCKILKKSYPNVNGLQDTLYCQNMKFKNMTAKQPSIQLHYTGQKHWVCSSYNKNMIYLYDSLFQRKTTMNLDTQLAKLYGTDSMQLEVIVPTMQTQHGTLDCGLFALASATCLAVGIDPATQSWDQKTMRSHCITCIEKEQATPFPASSVRGIRTGILPKSHILTIDLVCDCNLPEYAFCTSKEVPITRTVQCDSCKLWFHNQCYGLSNDSIKGDFFCTSCTSSN